MDPPNTIVDMGRPMSPCVRCGTDLTRGDTFVLTNRDRTYTYPLCAPCAQPPKGT